MRRTLLLDTLAILFFSFFFVNMAQAQYRASIQGVVTDEQGAVVPEAAVTLTNQETSRQYQAMTNGAGVFNFIELPPSRYTVSVDKAGFKKYTASDVQIIAEQSNALNVQLAVGTTGETVTVNGNDVPLVDAETATLSGTVTAQQIQSMPSFGRDVFQLAQLAPGVFGDGSRTNSGDSNALPGNAGPGGSGATTGVFATENGPQITAAGGRRELNNIQLDGVGITSVSWAGTAVVTPNEDSVKEVKVVANSYDAEDGRYPGAQIKIISQNGTNTYHGSAFFKADRPGLNAFTARGIPGVFDPVRNNARFNDLGGSVGGPILHNKLFGFFSYETIRNHGTTNTQDFFPTSQFLALAPPGSAAAKFASYPGSLVKGRLEQGGPGDPHSCTDIGLIEGTNCLTIPGQGLNVGRPLTSPLGTQDPAWASAKSPGTGGDGGGGANNLDPTTPDFAFYNVDIPDHAVNVQYNFRVDFNATSKDLLAFSMYYVPTSDDSFNGPALAMNLFHHTVVNEAETFLWNHTFSPTLLNEARVNAAGWRWQDLKNNPNGAWGLPIANFAELNAPTDSNNVELGYGTNGHINGFGEGPPGTFDQWTYAVKDVLTKVHNSHTIKMGGEITRLDFVDLAPWNARPTYQFRNLWDFLNDAPAEEFATFNPITGAPTDFRKDTRSNLYGFFFQDDYKLRPNLTLNLGVRWEYNGPISEKRGNLGVVELGQGPAALTGIRVRKGGNLYIPSKDDFGPQLGFAWSPGKFSNRLVLRGGFGIGYTGQEEATSLNGRNNPPFLSPAFNLAFNGCANPPTCSTTVNQVVYGPNTFPSSVHSFYGYAPNPFGTATFDPTTNLPVPGGQNFSPIDLTGYPANWADTRTYRYSAEVQYELGHEWVATFGYQGSATRDLTRQYNLNLFLFATQGLAFNPVVPHVDWYDEGGRANFNAILAEVRHQFSHSFQLNTQYRWSRAKDTGSNNYANGDYEFTLNHDYGRSDYDATNSLKIFGIWSPTIFRGNRGWMEKVAGGWTVSGILNAHSGFPYTVLYSDFCDAIYQGSCGGGGTSSLRPAAYLGGASSDRSNDAFIRPGGDFPNFNPANQGAAYFTPPSFTAGPSFTAVVGGAAPGPVPGAPGIPRNSFTGPRYLDVDATLSKSFGLPNMRLLGENAKIEFRANFFNLFNNLNLFNVQGDLTNTHFGQPQAALGARTIEMQARFSF
jgi:Carboxypeptidase regulatory-like domain/TonB dependent receptor